MTVQKSAFPLESDFLEKLLVEQELDLQWISIRELTRLVAELAEHADSEYLRFEFGIPGLPALRIGPEEEIKQLQENHQLPSTYPPFDGVPRLKEATANFIRQFMDIEVEPTNCIPTVGAMHGGFICQSIAGRRIEGADTILYLDPGFPVNKLQTRFLGLKTESVDLYDLRGDDLIAALKSRFASGKIGGLLWSNPNNPSWVSLKEEELAGIGQLLTEYDVIGIEDAAYFGMDFRQDYSQPGQPPFVPTIARYTDNYLLVLSSSKIFSYAGQRVAVTVISPGLMLKRYPYLRQFHNTELLGHAFLHGGIYPTTAGVPQTPQHALAAMLEAATSGEYNFLERVKAYGVRARKMKNIFLSSGFELVYADDMGEPLADGFYFTVTRPGMTGRDLLFQMLRFGMAGIPLSTTGTSREGLRICVSLIRDDQMNELQTRLQALDQHL
jgi:aspartate/methionine/tyrosine aminotransferase